ncbi:hypothetical protein [Curtobacterium flaccumfaciens]|uniref:hypothetical protein n=1 Tax=Curtobacterium flaccumfaciens TaxID=2035 RepID=UPI00387988F3
MREHYSQDDRSDRAIIVADEVLQRRSREFDLYAIQAGASLAAEYEARRAANSQGVADPERDAARQKVVSRYRDLTKFRHGDPADPSVIAQRAGFEYLRAIANAAHDIGLYLASVKKDPVRPRLPLHPSRVIAMFDYLMAAPKKERGRNLTEEEQAIYDQAKENEKTAPPLKALSLEEREALMTAQLQAKLEKNLQKRQANETREADLTGRLKDRLATPKRVVPAPATPPTSLRILKPVTQLTPAKRSWVPNLTK